MGKTLLGKGMIEIAGPETLGASNYNKKTKNLLGYIISEGITYTEIVDTVVADLTTYTKQILLDDEMDDTEYVEITRP